MSWLAGRHIYVLRDFLENEPNLNPNPRAMQTIFVESIKHLSLEAGEDHQEYNEVCIQMANYAARHMGNTRVDVDRSGINKRELGHFYKKIALHAPDLLQHITDTVTHKHQCFTLLIFHFEAIYDQSKNSNIDLPDDSENSSTSQLLSDASVQRLAAFITDHDIVNLVDYACCWNNEVLNHLINQPWMIERIKAMQASTDEESQEESNEAEDYDDAYDDAPWIRLTNLLTEKYKNGADERGGLELQKTISIISPDLNKAIQSNIAIERDGNKARLSCVAEISMRSGKDSKLKASTATLHESRSKIGATLGSSKPEGPESPAAKI